jgi:hypothetical protein
MITAAAGFAGMVELLLSRGADPSIVDSGGKSPLERAVECHRSDVTEILAKEFHPSNVPLPLQTSIYLDSISFSKDWPRPYSRVDGCHRVVADTGKSTMLAQWNGIASAAPVLVVGTRVARFLQENRSSHPSV